MKVIISESRLLNIAKKWLAEKYDTLAPITLQYYPNVNFFLKDGEILFSNNVVEESLVVDSEVRDMLESFFDLEYDQVREAVVNWVSEYYDIHPKKVYFGSFEHVELDEI